MGDTGKMTSLASGFVGVWGRSIDDRLGCGDCGGDGFETEKKATNGTEKPG